MTLDVELLDRAEAEAVEQPPASADVAGAEPSPGTPRWYWWGLGGVLVVATVLTTWGIGGPGLGNPYYAASAVSGAESWTAMFYGSIDAGNFITVDKPPLAMAVDAFSIRLFGLSSWSMLLPQVLAGVASVAVLAATVRRVWGPAAALLAAAVMALTPITVAMNRQNLPDTVLVLCLVGAAWALVRGLESGRIWWLLGSMALVGLGFNAKLLQAWIVLPALGLAWLFFAPGAWWRRILQGAAAGAVALAVSFSWMLVVDARADGALPHIGGSTDDTVADLVFGYNGLGRVFGGEGNPAQTALFDSGPGWGRMFNPENGDQISWLMPLAGICLVALIGWGLRRRDRLALGACTMWGLWLVVHAAVFSSAEGIYHPYYTYALSPAIGALVGAGLVTLWRQRAELWARATLAVGVVATIWWAGVLLDRVPTWNTWLAPTVLALGALAVLVTLVLTPKVGGRLRIGPAAGAATALVLVLVATLLAPTLYAASTLTRDDQTIASAGPNPPRVAPLVVNIVPPLQWNEGMLDYLQENWHGERWTVAVQGSFVGAPMMLEMEGAPVMVIGGFIGFDPVPAGDEFIDYVEEGELRYVLVVDHAKVFEIRADQQSQDAAGPFGADVDVDGSQELPPEPPDEFLEALEQTIERTGWVREHCTQVDPADYGGTELASQLWDCMA